MYCRILIIALLLALASPACGYGKSVEDLVGSFSIEKTVKIGSSSECFSTANDIDPLTRTLFFSNSLTSEKAVALHRYFTGKVGVAFGIGGHSVNNMGFDAGHDLPSMNIVAKAVDVNGHGTVKLSDDEGKHMGSPEDVARYKRFAAERIGQRALALVY